ncbi:MAG: YdeI/OmpD-associated family protein [Bacteroidota bacterium]
MKEYQAEQTIGQLEKRKGGYFFLKIEAEIVNQFENKRKTRLICRLDDQLDFRCGLNHLGDGNFFIILSKKNLSAVNKELGDTIHFHLREDPNPLGVDIPEVLTVLLGQDPELKATFDKLTMGKKRNVIHQIVRIKDLDKQISKTIELIQTAHLPRKRKEV